MPSEGSSAAYLYFASLCYFSWWQFLLTASLYHWPWHIAAPPGVLLSLCWCRCAHPKDSHSPWHITTFPGCPSLQHKLLEEIISVLYGYGTDDSTSTPHSFHPFTMFSLPMTKEELSTLKYKDLP
ncbi:hypothetical protein QOT17_018742 [Balamuthia mandrillaris]